MDKNQPTERFTSRVENYVRYRPNYPESIIPLLQQEAGLTASWVVADIGSGPGNLSRRFLDFGCTVSGVEPNQAMREAGETILENESGFISVAGSAESTTLPVHSVDLIVAGQAFHWFDPRPTRIEFRRILRDLGWVALIWNRRPDGKYPVLDAYSAMLRQYSKEYDRVVVQDGNATAGMNLLFGSNGYRRFELAHEQVFDAAGFWGRLLSSSYMPLSGEPGHEEIRTASNEIFLTYAENGLLHFPYETQIFLGRIE